MNLRKTQLGAGGSCFGVNLLMWVQSIWSQRKSFISLQIPEKKKRHYVKYNHKTVLLAQGSGRKFLTVAKSIKFCFTWIFVLCEVMRKMEHLVFLGITCRKSWILPTLLLQCDIQIPLTTQASSSAESTPSTWTQQGGLLAVVSYRKC